MLTKGKEGQFINWKKEQPKKVDSIQKDRTFDVLTKGGVKNVQYFKGLFSSTMKKEKGEAATNIKDQFMKSGTGNLSNPVPLGELTSTR